MSGALSLLAAAAAVLLTCGLARASPAGSGYEFEHGAGMAPYTNAALGHMPVPMAPAAAAAAAAPAYQDDAYPGAALAGAGPYAAAPTVGATAAQKGRPSMMQALRNDLDSVATRVRTNPRVRQVVEKAAPRIESFRRNAAAGLERGHSRLSGSMERYRNKRGNNKQHAAATIPGAAPAYELPPSAAYDLPPPPPAYDTLASDPMDHHHSQHLHQASLPAAAYSPGSFH